MSLSALAIPFEGVLDLGRENKSVTVSIVRGGRAANEMNVFMGPYRDGGTCPDRHFVKMVSEDVGID
jgi:hypothetical protein